MMTDDDAPRWIAEHRSATALLLAQALDRQADRLGRGRMAAQQRRVARTISTQLHVLALALQALD